MDNGQDRVDIGTAAIQLGITTEAIRKRIGRGTISASKKDGRWDIILDGVQDASRTSRAGHPGVDTEQDVQDGDQDGVQDTSKDRDKDTLIEALTRELEIRNKEVQEFHRTVQELHVLLSQAQTQIRAALTPPQRRAWWRWWK